MIALNLAFLADLILGDPVYAWHPVRIMGQAITKLEQVLYKDKMTQSQAVVRGTVLVVGLLGLVGVVYAALVGLLSLLGGWLETLGLAIFTYQLLATGCLYAEGAKLVKIIKSEDLDLAKKEIGYLVSRETDDLKMGDIAKAAVETLTENITDAIVAPLFYYTFFGVVGMALYKAINTMDSMVGYKNDRYLYFGRFAARLDDVANFIPARLAAGLIMVVALFRGHRFKESVRCFIHHRKFHSSPNAGCTEAAMAGALNMRLSGPTVYFGQRVERPFIGWGQREINHIDIYAVNAYVVTVGMLMLALVSVVLGVSS